MLAIENVAETRGLCETANMPLTPRDPALYEALLSLKPADLTENAWTVRAGVNRSFFQGLREGKVPRTDTLRRVLAAIDLTPAEFYARQAGDAVHLAVPATPQVRTTVQEYRAPASSDLIPTGTANPDLARDIPVLGTAEGAAEPVGSAGNGAAHAATVEAMQLLVSEVIERKARPSSLARRRDIYALYISGESMEPRFEQGELVYVDPKRPPSIGDYVIVQLRDASGEEHVDPDTVVRVLVKRLVKRRADAWEFEQFNPALRFTLPAAAIARIHRIMRLDELV